MSDRKVPVPDGYDSWLDYAIATMETRDLFLLQFSGGTRDLKCVICSCDRDDVIYQRSEMREAAQSELATLQSRAALVPGLATALEEATGKCEGMKPYIPVSSKELYSTYIYKLRDDIAKWHKTLARARGDK